MYLQSANSWSTGAGPVKGSAAADHRGLTSVQLSSSSASDRLWNTWHDSALIAERVDSYKIWLGRGLYEAFLSE